MGKRGQTKIISTSSGLSGLRSKRAQITTFIIIGVVLLLAMAVFLVVRSRVTTVPLTMSPEVEPIYHFVTSCSDQLATEAIQTIGITGGYVDIPANIRYNPMSYVSISPIEGIKMPYWYYDGVLNIPPLDFMESQISDHVKNGMPACLRNLTDFDNQFIIKQGELSVATTVAEQNVLVKVTLPLDIEGKTGVATYKLNDFITDVPIRLKMAYDLAVQVMNKENTDAFLEEKTLDLIMMSPQWPIGVAVPTTDIEFSCVPKLWPLKNVSNRIKELVRNNLPRIKVDKTNYIPIEDIYTYQKVHYLWPVTEKKYDMKVSFTYDDNLGMELHVRPSNGAYLTSNPMKGQKMLDWICIHLWHFTYDISYPVIVTIRDDATASHKGFTFAYPLQVSIDHNEASRKVTSTSAFLLPDAPLAKQFCEERKVNWVTIQTINDVTGEDVPDINLTFTCLKFMCNMGASEWKSGGAIAGIYAQFPFCINGILRGKGSGFLDAEKFISTNVPESYDVLRLTPVKAIKNVSVVKYVPPSPKSRAITRETVLVQITDTKSGFTSMFLYPESVELPEFQLLADKDVTYEVSIFMTDQDKLVGGYRGNWTVAWEDLKYADSIEFSLVEFLRTATDEEIATSYMNIENLSVQVPKPKLKVVLP
jgi:hypothetical protein